MISPNFILSSCGGYNFDLINNLKYKIMKKILMLVAVVLGTTVMVNAQTTPVKEATTKEVKSVKHTKKVKVEKKAEAVKANAAATTPAVKVETAKVTKTTAKK